MKKIRGVRPARYEQKPIRRCLILKIAGDLWKLS